MVVLPSAKEVSERRAAGEHSNFARSFDGGAESPVFSVLANQGRRGITRQDHHRLVDIII